jgi:hypothetical protein
MSEVIVLGRTDSGFLVAGDGEMPFQWYLTECCAASAKGSSNCETGVCCRACYAEIDTAYGGIYDEKFDGKINPLDAEDRAFVTGKGFAVAATV